MKRLIAVVLLSALLALSGTVLAASSPANDLDGDNGLRHLVPVAPIDASDDVVSDDTNPGLVTPNGAIWPKGVW